MKRGIEWSDADLNLAMYRPAEYAERHGIRTYGIVFDNGKMETVAAPSLADAKVMAREIGARLMDGARPVDVHWDREMKGGRMAS